MTVEMSVEATSAPHWATQYIGIGWEAGAQGQGADGALAFDCWAFFRHIQRLHYGIDVPLVQASDYDDAGEIVTLINGHEERGRWSPIATPRDGDGVIVHRPLHVGVWLDVDGSGVLHCVRGSGVIFTRDKVWQHSGFGRREFHRFSGAAT